MPSAAAASWRWRADFRIASETARFGLPEIKIGAFPGGGGRKDCTRLIGAAKAKEMILIGDPITAEQALAIGLVMKVAPKEKLYGRGHANSPPNSPPCPASRCKPRRC